jgi:hypothetical protein
MSVTEPIEVQNARKRAKRAEALRDAFEKTILKDMTKGDEAARRAACKLYNDRALERIEELQVKAEWSATGGAEVRKVEDKMRDERAGLSAREVAIKKREDMMTTSTNTDLTRRAFEFFWTLVRRMKSWEPEEAQFFDSQIPKSPWIWQAWWPEEKARLWCAWEIELAVMPREKQIGTIAHELHVRTCINHQNEKIDLTPERMLFIQARLKHMGSEVQQAVFDIGRTKTEVCRLQPHPMQARHLDFDFGHRTNLRQRILTGDVPQGEQLPEWLA